MLDVVPWPCSCWARTPSMQLARQRRIVILRFSRCDSQAADHDLRMSR